MLHPAQLVADGVDGVQVIRVHAQDLGARVRGDVDEILCRQAIVDRHEDGTDLRHGIERFKLLVHVRSDVGNTITLLDAHALQGRRPAVAPLEELLVGEAEVSVDDALPIPVKLPRPSCELQRCKRGLHAGLLPYGLSIRAKSAALMPPTNALCTLSSSSTDRSYTNA